MQDICSVEENSEIQFNLAKTWICWSDHYNKCSTFNLMRTLSPFMITCTYQVFLAVEEQTIGQNIKHEETKIPAIARRGQANLNDNDL